MKSAALERLESLLQARKLADTLPPPLEAPRLSGVPAGIGWLDARLAGGWPRGHLSEVVGGRSSGRTSVLVATLASATASGAVVALIDTVDRFDPRSAEAAGLDLDRLLWVRGPALSVESARPALVVDAVARAIRACDLVIRAGGFAVVALDLADVPSRAVGALPFTTWRRLAFANEGRPSVCLVAGDAPMGRSARGVSIALEGRAIWTGNSAQSRQFKGIETGAQVQQGQPVQRVPGRH